MLGSESSPNNIWKREIGPPEGTAAMQMQCSPSRLFLGSASSRGPGPGPGPGTSSSGAPLHSDFVIHMYSKALGPHGA